MSLVPSLITASDGGFVLASALYLVLLIAVMVGIYNIAKSKGRHPVGWVVLGFFFFVLALVLLLLLPSKLAHEGVERL